MNKTLIAAAVSAALMAPVAVQAEDDGKSVTLYGRIHNGIKFVDTDGADSTTDLNGAGGRFGIKASSDLGNGMTASAHYEFSTSTDAPGESSVVNEDDEEIGTTGTFGKTRVATVGVSGGFGSITLGVHQWNALYSIANTADYTYTSPGVLYYDIGPSRTSNTIKYSNSFGPVSLQLDSRVDDSEDGNDGFAVGVSYAVNDMISFAGAIDDSDSGTLTALQARVNFGNYYVALGQFASDPESGYADPSRTQAWLGGSWGNTSALIGLGSGDNDTGDTAGNDPSGTTLGVYQSLGGGLTLMYEGGSRDNDGGTKADSTSHWFGMMYNF